MYIIRLKTAATVEPVTLAEQKAWSRVSNSLGDADDTLLASAIVAARRQAENLMGGGVCVESTWEQILEAFPVTTRDNPRAAIELLRHPVISVSSIAYVDANGVTQTLGVDQYSLVLEGGPGLGSIHPAYGCAWPDTRDQVDAVTVTFKAGWALSGAAATTPENIKAWIKMQVAALYENPEAAVAGSGGFSFQEIPRPQFNGLLDEFCVVRA